MYIYGRDNTCMRIAQLYYMLRLSDLVPSIDSTKGLVSKREEQGKERDKMMTWITRYSNHKVEPFGQTKIRGCAHTMPCSSVERTMNVTECP